MSTLVKFRIHPEHGEVIAIFPQLKYNKIMYGNSILTAYAHIGQHTSAHKDYIAECRPASVNEYRDLFLELENIGYNLKICK